MPRRQVLTLKYRPQSFAELLIQDHVKNTLTRAIEHNRLANAYLFAGPRGVGKTTTARILAKSLNCLSYDRPTITPCNTCSACVEIAESRSMDVLEIDGASNRGIDQVRELRENIKYVPASLRYKVYIIDEVHMLTKEAFNALLKTLEEPPAHAKFIFATTAAHELPLTILSRCQRFDFRKATPAEIVERLTWLAEKEHIRISPEALTAIARRADGAIRDAEGILDLLTTYSPEGVELKHAEEVLGLVPSDTLFDYADMIADANPKPVIEFIERIFASGYDLIEFYAGIVTHFRNLLWAKIGGLGQDPAFLPEEVTRYQTQAERFQTKQLMSIIDTLSRNEYSAKHSLLPKILLEIISLELMSAGSEKPGTGDRRKKTEKQTAGVEDPEMNHQTRGPSEQNAAAIWQQVILKIQNHRPSLAKLLECVVPVSYQENKLTVAFPSDRKGIIHHLKDHQRQIEHFLIEVTGSPGCLETIVIQSASQPDITIKKIREHFGEVDQG
ncbi:MAG: DNA polymerase III subunit gamma/tau [bacterium]